MAKRKKDQEPRGMKSKKKEEEKGMKRIPYMNELTKPSLDELLLDYPRVSDNLEHDGKSKFDPFDTVTAVVRCDTTKGPLTIDVRQAWSPLGSVRFLELLDMDMFTNLPFFRVAPRYITQFGPKFNSKVQYKTIKDDPSLVGKRDMNFGHLFFAGSGI